jgi:hypothetical protein
VARNVYRVQHINNMWRVRHEGTTLSSHMTKEAAIDAGRKVAQANRPSQLVVHRMDGTIEIEWTYGNDPFPPRG